MGSEDEKVRKPRERRHDDSRWMHLEKTIIRIETHMERSVPALKQVWTNKDDILKLQSFHRSMKWIGGIIVSLIAVFKAIGMYFSKYH
jgi:hypothetical protein